MTEEYREYGTTAYEAEEWASEDPDREGVYLGNPEASEATVETLNQVDPTPIPVVDVGETRARRKKFSAFKIVLDPTARTPTKIVSELSTRSMLTLSPNSQILIGHRENLEVNNGFFVGGNDRIEQLETVDEMWAIPVFSGDDRWVYVYTEYEIEL